MAADLLSQNVTMWCKQSVPVLIAGKYRKKSLTKTMHHKEYWDPI